jgi:hypothetical protein
MIDVHNQFKLLPDTLYLIVNIVDRFMAKKAISPFDHQLRKKVSRAEKEGM